MPHYLLKKIACQVTGRGGFITSVLMLAALLPANWRMTHRHNCQYPVCVLSTPIHTNILVPAQVNAFDWSTFLSLESIGVDANDDYQYLSFGWGDRAFYMQTPTLADLDLPLTLKTLFWPTPSVLYVQGFAERPHDPTLQCVELSADQYLNLMTFIKTTFETTYNRPNRIGHGHRPNAGFFAAKGNYSILRHCNTWVLEGLRLAGVQTPLLPTLPATISLHLNNNCDDG
jgi:uncharacterized protein (TIGR02117 family)